MRDPEPASKPTFKPSPGPGPRTKVAVVFGGPGGEHDVSCRSAAAIIAHLDPERYDVLPVRITRAGAWHVGKYDPSSGGAESGPGVDAAALARMTGQDAMATGDGTGPPPEGPATWRGIADAVSALGDTDVVFPALHGPFGEDGTIQALLETAGIPYVGNGVLASAAGMDKEFSKRLLAGHGLAVAEGTVLTGADDTLTREDRERLGLPVFVKPARAGSSLGVTRVDAWEDLEAALAVARESDSKVLVEQAVRGREIDVAVLEHPDGRIEAGPALEIRVGEGRPFFDFDAKYGDGGTVFDIPARIDAEAASRLRSSARRVFRALGCSGLLRVDFFLRDGDDGLQPVVNEVNTFPGFTPASQFPRIWKTAGYDYPALLDILIATALGRALEGG